MFSLFRSLRTASAGSPKRAKAGAPRTRPLRFEGLEVREVFAGAVTFDNVQFQGNESAGQISAGLTFTAFGTGSGFTVDIQLQQVSATAGTDFNSSTITLTFPSYSSGQVISRTVNVPIANDRTVEDLESFQAVIGTISDPNVIANSSGSLATMEIVDNDSAVIRFAPASLTVNEGAGNQTLQVQLAFNTNGTGPQTIQNPVDVIIDAPSNSGDFNFDTFVSFAGGSGPSSQPINIAPIDDNIIEPNEVFAVRLRVEPPVPGVTLGPDLSLTIVDNDSPVVNRPPTTVIRGPASGVSNQPLKFLLIARDADPVDQAANFTFVIAWGDGTTDTVVGPSGTSVAHAFRTTGPFVPTATATDARGTLGRSDTTNVLIRNSILTGMDLVIGGTPENDTIIFQPIDLVGNVRTIINGKDQGVSHVCSVVFFGGSGEDTVLFQTRKTPTTLIRLQLTAEIHGGGGNDLINGSGNFGPGSYFGDDGNDVLIGGLGKDLLVGGPGTDTIRGQPGDTIINNAAPQPTALRTDMFLASTVAKKKR